MIQIVNTNERTHKEKEIYLYELLINDRLICRFEHDRTIGLSACLREAANAVERVRKFEKYLNTNNNADATVQAIWPVPKSMNLK